MRFSPAIAIVSAFCLLSPAAMAQSDSSGDSGNPFSAIGDLFSSGTKTKVTSGQDTPNINEVQSEAYDGPKARVAVARFTDKTRKGWYNGRIGDGMADQLATALFNTNRYILLERQTLGDVIKEQDLGASGRVKRATAAPIGEIEGAEILVTGAVTEFEPGASGSKGGVSGGKGGMFGSIVGAVSGAFSSAHLAIDIRLIDTKTSRIIAATSVEGKTTDVDLGGAVGGYFGGGRLGGALSMWDKEPIGKALRIAINEAVKFVVSKTPPIYYRHGGGGTASSTPSRTGSGASGGRPATASFAPGTVVQVKTSSLNIRSGPGGSNPVVFRAQGGEALRVKSQQGSWIQIEDQNGRTGWAASWLTTPASASAFSAASGSGSGSSSGGGAAARLKKLKSLYDQGLITESDYNAKRKEILEQL